MPRFTELTPETMTAQQKEVADRIAGGARAGVKGPFPAWLHAPELADRMQAVGRYIRWETTFPARLSELAILVTAARWKARYEWYAHHKFAMDGGLRPEIAEAIRVGQTPKDLAEDEAAVYAFARELNDTGNVSDATFARAKSLFGERGCAELLATCGYYTAVGFTLNVAGVPLPPGEPDPFA
ncbi:carboxymuconolactone decarboxylase family protein [Sabulicella glaciei]|uniref:Carboxymuconolactone decarboxylase family protein n=1 Tax=Sabulicella glaciei TaxID=2984948 RepID=A0ABT3NTI7_9PROT|nr:carboxymuconolactone decarboxylase family protein [Roseococcus sp. MDT2-1-1]MCW8085477.1 carboxymuconolactone decarboxylase family protein [Roseococcus sp. MDT2-1-1]